MPKHGISKDLPDAKRRRQSIISDENTNPLGEDGLSQCFKTVKTTMYVSIPPVYSQTPLLGVASQNLDPIVMRYYAPAQGVVVAYSGIEFLGQDETGDGPKVAKIISDSPFAFAWIKVDLLCWSPAVGDTVDGYISAQSPGHIALLIHDTFNATIKRDDIPSTWTFQHGELDEEGEDTGGWVDAHGERIESKLRFIVKSFNTSGRTVHVLGSLLTIADVNRVYEHKSENSTEQESVESRADSKESAIDSNSESESESESDSSDSSEDEDESE